MYHCFDCAQASSEETNGNDHDSSIDKVAVEAKKKKKKKKRLHKCSCQLLQDCCLVDNNDEIGCDTTDWSKCSTDNCENFISVECLKNARCSTLCELCARTKER
eukprot:CAMPEP_0174979480 /NCGR_PEP_ID=MMETSP0004_2-20121128/14803_1 /TAXON_ID=420556 /ORGANISM="Ochromonas sp., Strain CCMP1393" /LENGTH=103 /DNA_ID=CAMNT_0016231009 /DNA_START=251 /DNA_END=562 /DNA_ORIENTATION=+